MRVARLTGHHDELVAALTRIDTGATDETTRPMRSPWWIVPFALLLCAFGLLAQFALGRRRTDHGKGSPLNLVEVVRRPCRKAYGRHKDSKRTRLIHRPCGDIVPPIGGIQVFSSCSIVRTSL